MFPISQDDPWQLRLKIGATVKAPTNRCTKPWGSAKNSYLVQAALEESIFPLIKASNGTRSRIQGSFDVPDSWSDQAGYKRLYP